MHFGTERLVFVLQPHSGVPLYRQLYEQIRRMVASGQLTPGTELPSIRDWPSRTRSTR